MLAVVQKVVKGQFTNQGLGVLYHRHSMKHVARQDLQPEVNILFMKMSVGMVMGTTVNNTVIKTTRLLA